MTERYYRFVDRLVSVTVDPDGDLYGSAVHVDLKVYEVTRRTPKGCWVIEIVGCFRSGTRHFVLDGATKRFALPTIGEALASFEARKVKQARIAGRRIANAREAVKIAVVIASRLDPLVRAPECL